MRWIFILLIFILLVPKNIIQAQVNVSPVQEIPINDLEHIISPVRPMRSQDSLTSIEIPDLGNQQYIRKNGDPQEKLDILFIPWRISDLTILPDLIEKLFYVDDSGAFDGLFLHPPFSEFQQKFNISFIDKNIEEDFFECYVQIPEPGTPPGSYLYHGCNDFLVKSSYAQFQPDYIVILFDLPPGYHSTGGEIMYLESDTGSENNLPELENYIAWVFVHEFGHQFGGLADEYIMSSGSVAYQCGLDEDPECFDRYYNRAISTIPNLDKTGCPKWCKQYNLESLIVENSDCSGRLTLEQCLEGGNSSCTWFRYPHPVLGSRCVISNSRVSTGTQCIEEVTCNLGADYAPLAFRPEEASIMNGGQSFNMPSKIHLSKALECCYPKSDSTECQQFRASIASPYPETNSHLTKALRKIATCPALGECQRSIKSLIQNYMLTATCLGFDANMDGKQNVLDIAVEM